MRKTGYKGLFEGVRSKFGSAGDAFLYYLGCQSGIEYCKSHLEIAEKLGISDPEEIIKRVTIPIFSSVGFGRIDVSEMITTPTFKATVKVYECFECEVASRTEKPFSQFIRGIFAAYLTKLFNKKINVEETKCIAKGDPHCELVATQE